MKLSDKAFLDQVKAIGEDHWAKCTKPVCATCCRKRTIEDAMFESIETVKKEGCIPADVWDPIFGWIIVDGEKTNAFEKYYEFISSSNVPS